MLTGGRPFTGETNVATMAAIVGQEPMPVSQIVQGVPAELDRVLARCLRSNDVLHMLVDGPVPVEGEKGLGKSGVKKLRFNCLGIVEPPDVLYRAEVLMAPLDSIVA